MNKPEKIFLIGPMGAGKSTIGRALSRRLRLPFTDMDERIVQQTDRSIPEIFAQDGEATFRAIESTVLAELCDAAERAIIATGGGAILAPGNRERMRASGHIVWLDLPPEASARRIAGDGNRPLIQGVDALQKAQQLDGERRPLYASISGLHLHTDQLTVEQTVDLILEGL